MEDHFDLEALEKEAWPLKKKFLRMIEPYRLDLWRYCRSLTRSAWDAEDLVQETLMRAFASLGQVWQPLMPKSYLFRIATNTWINQSRRNKISFSPIVEETQLTDDVELHKFEVHEAIELLIQHLPPRQVVVILLIDVFDFTARETAEMIATTEGAVKAILHRARVKLKSLSNGEISQNEQESKHVQRIPDPTLVQAFIEAFNRRDPDAMAALLADHAYNDIVHVGQEYGRETIRTYSIRDTMQNPTIHLQTAHYHTLLGKPVVVFLVETESGPQLNDMCYMETEDSKIVYIKDFYFCKQLLTEAAQELNISVAQLTYDIHY